MTPWNVLNSSAADPFLFGNEPLHNQSFCLTKMKTVRLASWDEVTLLAL